MLLYGVASAVATVAVLHHAVTTRHQFYPTVIHLVTNKASLLVLCNQAIVCVVAFAYMIKSLFLGSLKPTEVEVREIQLQRTAPCACTLADLPAAPLRSASTRPCGTPFPRCALP